MAVIVSTCCCEDDGGDPPDPPDEFSICCADPPAKLTISINAVYSMETSQSVHSRRYCCPGSDCSGPGHCLGMLWAGQTSYSLDQTISGTIEIDLDTFEKTMTGGASSVVQRGECHWQCYQDCFAFPCPCSNDLSFQNDGSTVPDVFVEIYRAINTSNYPCSGETVYPGDCVVRVTFVSGLTGDYNYNLSAGCNDGTSGDTEAPEGQVWSHGNYATASYRVYEHHGSCEISDIPFETKMKWGPLIDYDVAWYTHQQYHGDPLEEAWEDRYGTIRPGMQDPGAFNPEGNPCIGNGWPNGSWYVSYDQTSSGGGNCSHPNVHDYSSTSRAGTWMATTSFDSSAVFS